MESALQPLQEHRQVCQELLAAFEREAAGLQSGELTVLAEVDALRRQVLPRLQELTRELRARREAWERLPAAQRQMPAGWRALLEENQAMVLRLLALDRENQQARLRLGLVPPAHWPAPRPASGQGYVTELYRRHTAA
ncbi:MAG: hypothetical protein N3J91_07050 [Verrucomicrobiae bacterium]|nr:hypothetical protein [Verrucomicrobiae bacterium]